MENDSDDRPSADEAAANLRGLSSDRASLVDILHLPRTLLAAYGGVGAWWVAAAVGANPGENYRPPMASVWLGLVAVLVISHLVHRETGIRFRTMGTRSAVATIAALVGCLTLFSISLGLVAFDLTWAVALTSLAAFGLVSWLAGVAYRAALHQLRHV